MRGSRLQRYKSVNILYIMNNALTSVQKWYNTNWEQTALLVYIVYSNTNRVSCLGFDFRHRQGQVRSFGFLILQILLAVLFVCSTLQLIVSINNIRYLSTYCLSLREITVIAIFIFHTQVQKTGKIQRHVLFKSSIIHVCHYPIRIK